MFNFDTNHFLYIKKSDLNTRTIYIAGIPLFKIYNCPKTDYKKQKIQILGIKFVYKSKSWLEKINKENVVQNKTNLCLDIPKNEKNILLIAANYNKAGGIETRIIQYSKKLIAEGWNVYLLSEKNENEKLLQLTNFYLNFDADNVHECLKEIIDRYNIKILEFQFKKTKILKNLNLLQLKNEVKIGCVIHNLGVQDITAINSFDYKIMVSRYMYENFYKGIENAAVIQNSIDTTENKQMRIWEYKNQKTALLISRISSDKIKSIECFIKYCQKYNIKFKIAGDEPNSGSLKVRLMKKFKLSAKSFIGQIDTLTYLSNHSDEILFVGGVGLVILESLYLGYPCLCCSDFNGQNYSFITETNISLFDNFTISKLSKVSKLNKKEHQLDTENISVYCNRDYIIKHRDLQKNFADYLNIFSLI